MDDHRFVDVPLPLCLTTIEEAEQNAIEHLKAIARVREQQLFGEIERVELEERHAKGR